MKPRADSGENWAATGTESKNADGVQFSNALALHASMVKVRTELPEEPNVGLLDLSLLVPYLNGRAVPWPQIGELRSFAQRFLGKKTGDSLTVQDVYEELLALTNDLAIWIVERFYCPESPVAVSQLAPELQQAGFGYLLYRCYENERQWLGEEELTPFQRLIERWINAIWDGNIKLPFPADVQTISQLIAWLANTDAAVIPYPIRQRIRELSIKVYRELLLAEQT